MASSAPHTQAFYAGLLRWPRQSHSTKTHFMALKNKCTLICHQVNPGGVPTRKVKLPAKDRAALFQHNFRIPSHKQHYTHSLSLSSELVVRVGGHMRMCQLITTTTSPFPSGCPASYPQCLTSDIDGHPHHTTACLMKLRGTGLSVRAPSFHLHSLSSWCSSTTASY